MQPKELVREWVNAFNRADVDALVSLYEPDATVILSGAPAAGAVEESLLSPPTSCDPPVSRRNNLEIPRH